MPRMAWRTASSSACGLAAAHCARAVSRRRTLGRLAHDRVVVLDHHPVGGMLEGEPRQPGVMGTAPGPHPDRRHDGAAQQELAQPVLGAQQVHLGIVACPDQVAQGLVGLVGDPDRREVAAAQQPCQLGRIALVGLDPVTGFDGDERGRHDHARDAHGGQLAMEGVAGGARLVGDLQVEVRPAEPLHQPSHCGRIVGDLAVLLGIAEGPRNRDGDRRLVHVQSHEAGTLIHGPASRMWLCAGKLERPAQSTMMRERRSFHVG